MKVRLKPYTMKLLEYVEKCSLLTFVMNTFDFKMFNGPGLKPTIKRCRLARRGEWCALFVATVWRQTSDSKGCLTHWYWKHIILPVPMKRTMISVPSYSWKVREKSSFPFTRGDTASFFYHLTSRKFMLIFTEETVTSNSKERNQTAVKLRGVNSWTGS